MKDLDIGKIDSRNEVIHPTEKEREKFEDSFLLPENIDISKFLDTENFEHYYIKGLKGVGKTCLLRHISLKIDKMDDIHSTFILFKSDLKDYKSELVRSANQLAVIKGSINESYDNNENNNNIFNEEINPNELRLARVIDYGILWDWIIHKKIGNYSAWEKQHQ